MAKVSLSDSQQRALTNSILRLFKKHPVAAIVAAVAVVIVLGGSSILSGVGGSADQPSAGSVDANGMTQAQVVRVVDGDTIQVDLDGERQRVRLIGINCPESVAEEEYRNTAEGVDASDFTKSIVSEGDTVWLQSDQNDTDQYDRLLRYVWIELPTDPFDEDEIAGKMLNAILVSEGYAEARVYDNDDLYADELDDLEREAVRNDRGVSYMWAEG